MTTRSVTGHGPARAIDVIAFNALPFAAGPIAVAIAVLAAISPAPAVVRAMAGVAAIVGAVAYTSAVVAILWVFEWSADRRWDWVAEAAGRRARWLNVTTGFDDSTDRIRSEIGPAGQTIDLFDETVDHEVALLRARRRYPPAVAPTAGLVVGPSTNADPVDAVLLLMSAHELREARRQATFGAVASVLGPSGRLVLVEHLRDLPNVLAFGPGAWHFESRATWLATATSAGLCLVDEARLSPFVRGFVFEAAR